MTLFAENILTDVRQTLQDEGATRKWEDADLVRYLNEGMRTIVLYKPDANVKTTSTALAAGTRQTLPADGLRLFKVTRNMGADGNTPGRVVTRADEVTLALFSPDWHSQNPADEVRNYLYDDRDPKVFWVNPPANGGRQVELVYSAAPAEVDADALNYDTPAVQLPLDDVYEAPLKAWVLRCAFGVEVSSAASQNKSIRYEQSFAGMLGLKWRVDLFVSPNRSQPSEQLQ